MIFALDQIDEIALQGVGKFMDYDVIDASKENADLGERSDEEKEKVSWERRGLARLALGRGLGGSSVGFPSS